MHIIEIVWLVTCGVLGSAGTISLQQARYYDGDPDAHWGEKSALAHTPRHPAAIRAMRRGWWLWGANIVLLTVGFGVKLLRAS